jgi:hypothetical protein
MSRCAMRPQVRLSARDTSNMNASRSRQPRLPHVAVLTLLFALVLAGSAEAAHHAGKKHARHAVAKRHRAASPQPAGRHGGKPETHTKAPGAPGHAVGPAKSKGDKPAPTGSTPPASPVPPVGVPPVSLPAVKVPPVSLPSVTVPPVVTTPPITVPPITVPPIEIPPVVTPPSSTPCTQTLSSGANVSTAISNATAGAIICLPAGATSFNVSNVSKSGMVTVRGNAGGTVGYSALHRSSNLRFEGIHFTGGFELLGATSNIQILNNEFTGPFGIHAGGEAHTTSGSKVSNVTIEGNYLHNLDYTGSQGAANGYGITASDGVANFTIRGNTIKSPASDYVQSASPVNFTVEGNTFLGPSLLGSHEDHQDLWQIFGGGTNIVFRGNVARNTETQESLLFQEGAFQNVVVEDNLFDHDSRGYTCQIYQSTGLVFRRNTIVGSRWGCLFRDLSSAAPGSGYAVDHNVFVGTQEGSAVSTEGRAASWGTYDWNVSDDASASGSHSVRNWRPTWSDQTNYVPSGLSFEAGFRP